MHQFKRCIFLILSIFGLTFFSTSKADDVPILFENSWSVIGTHVSFKSDMKDHLFGPHFIFKEDSEDRVMMNDQTGASDFKAPVSVSTLQTTTSVKKKNALNVIDNNLDVIQSKAANGVMRLASVTKEIDVLPTDEADILSRNSIFKSRVARAVEANPFLGVARSQTAGNAEAVNEAEAGFYPKLQMYVSGGSDLTQPTGAYASSSYGRTDLVFNASQLLYDFGATDERIGAAKYTEWASKYEGLDSVNMLTLDAINAYLDIISARAKLELSELNVEKHNSYFEMVQKRVEAKVAAQSDMDQVKSRLAFAQAELSALTGAVKNAEATFTEYFDEEAGDILFPVLTLNIPEYSEALLREAISMHPLMKVRDMELAAARHSKGAVEGDNLPKFMLEMDATRYDVGPGYDADGSGDPYGVLLRLNVVFDLYDGGAGSAREKKSNYNVSRIQNQKDSFQRELSRKIKFGYAEVDSAQQTLSALALSVTASLGTVDSYGQKYQTGKLSLMDLLDSQADYFKSAMVYYGGRSKVVSSQFNVLMLTGRLLDYFDVEVKDFVVADSYVTDVKSN